MKIFWSFARQAFHSSSIYRFDFWLRVVNNLVWMVSAYWLWRVLYQQKAGAFGISMQQMITYALVSSVITIVMRPGAWVSYDIAHKVKTGEIVMDMLNPLDFHLHMFARNFGQVLFFVLALGVPSLLAAILLMGMQLPSSLSGGLLFVLSLLMGYGILFSFYYLLGLISIFTVDIRNISWAYNSVLRFFSGSEVPLWLFPLFLRQIADWLPFKCMYAIPLSIYINKLSPSETVTSLALQAGWLAVLVLIGRWLWGRAYSRLTVQGG